MPQSPELAGGDAFTFEGAVAAFYLTSLLAEVGAEGMGDRIVSRVAVQQRDFGYPLDDIIIDFRNISGELARLSFQVKRSLTISSAKSNTDFRDIIRDCWATLNKNNFQYGVDRFGAAVGEIAKAKERGLHFLCESARESLKFEHFNTRFNQAGNASQKIKTIKKDIEILLNELNGSSCTEEQIHQFLAHFVLIKFDFLHEGAAHPIQVINRIRDCLIPSDAEKASLIWSHLNQLARTSAGKSGEFNRTRLVRSIKQVARLRGANSLCTDLERLTILGKSYAEGIQDDIGGTRIERTSLFAEINSKLNTTRFVQICGLPGSGKSVLLRQSIQSSMHKGSILFLKGDQLEGRSWISFANAQGLSVAKLETLLVEIAATGSAIFYIDALDRIEKEHQPIILDILRAIKESPLLDDWRILFSLRDTGIEPIRNWMGELLDTTGVATVDVNLLNDDEAKILAMEKPHLKSLLFGPPAVKEIARRPFFAKILNQNFVIDQNAQSFKPQTEIDLIENWWSRGGYNAIGQNAIERQRAILELARVRALHLSEDISLRELTTASVSLIDQFVIDGILQHVRCGHTVRFSHDIFFEWGFFHVLTERGEDWLEEISACGEPPAIARAAELVSQWEYINGKHWSQWLANTSLSLMRSQWTRAWLLGPLGAFDFANNEAQFAQVVFADNFHFLQKALVWFQADKTTPNRAVLSKDLPQDQRLRFADRLAWPSDFAMWRRFISFLLRHITNIPTSLYSDVLAIFDVWQNACADLRNTVSPYILAQCAKWLQEIDNISSATEPNTNSAHWKQLTDLSFFRSSLSSIILKASRSEPTFAEEYLRNVISSKDIREDRFNEIVTFSPTLAQSHPRLILELTLTHLKKELPDEKTTRIKAEARATAENRKRILAKPEAELAYQEKLYSSSSSSILDGLPLSSSDWDKLSLDYGWRCFSPPSPLREPFYSLFKWSPMEALRLMKDLCNHAMTAWRQLHNYHFMPDNKGTPIPLEINFPWGIQKFWGKDQEYLWFRTFGAPKPLACGFMALEEWCFAELERGRQVDDLIQQIVEGNECIAILGVAVVLALHTETISDAIFPLVTSQRLLNADHNRRIQDFAKDFNLIGFYRDSDHSHIKMIHAANERKVRQKELQQLIMHYVLGNKTFSDRTKEAILAFKHNLPFLAEEHRENTNIREHLSEQALEYAELADPENYFAYELKDNSTHIAVVHISPSASENVLEIEKAKLNFQKRHLRSWADSAFKNGTLGDALTVSDAVALARKFDSETLFNQSIDEEDIEMTRGAVAATAAIVLNFRQDATQTDIRWARDLLKRAIITLDKRGVMQSPSSIIPWHQSIFIARGLSADLRENTAQKSTVTEILSLITHPLEIVSLTALEEACLLWTKDIKLAWSALLIAFSLCHIQSRSLRETNDRFHSLEEIRIILDIADRFYKDKENWHALPLPPPAWVKLEEEAHSHSYYNNDLEEEDVNSLCENWGEPTTYWNSEYAAKILPLLPLEEILTSDAKKPFLDFISNLLSWTIQKKHRLG